MAIVPLLCGGGCPVRRFCMPPFTLDAQTCTSSSCVILGVDCAQTINENYCIYCGNLAAFDAALGRIPPLTVFNSYLFTASVLRVSVSRAGAAMTNRVTFCVDACARARASG
jgi:hypothetical protein